MDPEADPKGTEVGNNFRLYIRLECFKRVGETGSWKQEPKLRPICEANRYLAHVLMKYADYLCPSTEVVPGIIYPT